MTTKESILLRSNFFLYLLVCLFLLLLCRLFTIQVIQHNHYQKLATSQQFRKISLPARRGDILSSNGKLLARSIEVYSLYAIPKYIKKKDEFLTALFSLLKLDPSVQKRLRRRVHKKRFRNFLWIFRHLSAGDYGKIKNEIKKKKIKGLAFEKEFKRYYPQGSLLCHILGFTDVDGKGIEALERRNDGFLQGHNGYQLIGVDALSRRLPEKAKEEVAPKDGGTLVLTIDSVIQSFVEEQLSQIVGRWKPKAIAAVVIDVTNGKVVALANWPNYDPNHPKSAPMSARRNRSITDYYEPGSTIKVFTALGAVKAGVVSWDDIFPCHYGRFRFGPRLITDCHGYGDLSVRKIVIKSSNIGMAQIGVKLGDVRVRENVINFGFGQKTGIEIPGEEKGKVTSYLFSTQEGWNIPLDQKKIPQNLRKTFQSHRIQLAKETTLEVTQPHLEWRLHSDFTTYILRWEQQRINVYRAKKWSFYSTTSVAMGYEIGVTALQLAQGYSAVVNGGYLYKPTLIEKRLVDGEVVQSFHPTLVRRVYRDPKLQKQVLSVLQGVVEQGTAKSARLKDYTVGGKTGTARRNARGRRGYTSQYLASFVAVAPITSPRLVVVIMTDSPKGAMYGGTVSAPAAAQILQSSLSYLGVAPDKKPEDKKEEESH